MPGKKRDLKKIKKITLDKAKPSAKTGQRHDEVRKN